MEFPQESSEQCERSTQEEQPEEPKFSEEPKPLETQSSEVIMGLVFRFQLDFEDAAMCANAAFCEAIVRMRAHYPLTKVRIGLYDAATQSPLYEDNL